MYIIFYASDDLLEDVFTPDEYDKFRKYAKKQLEDKFPGHDIYVLNVEDDELIKTDDEKRFNKIEKTVIEILDSDGW